MRGFHWTVSALLAAGVSASGCGGPSKRTLAASEPGLSAASAGDSNVAIIEPARAATASNSFVDRHPLFSKPRQFYQQTGRNRATRTASAAVLGVPAGIFGEIKQIVVGGPATP